MCVKMDFEYIKHIIGESEEVLIKIGCTICLAIFVGQIIRNKFSDLFKK